MLSHNSHRITRFHSTDVYLFSSSSSSFWTRAPSLRIAAVLSFTGRLSFCLVNVVFAGEGIKRRRKGGGEREEGRRKEEGGDRERREGGGEGRRVGEGKGKREVRREEEGGEEKETDKWMDERGV